MGWGVSAGFLGSVIVVAPPGGPVFVGVVLIAAVQPVSDPSFSLPFLLMKLMPPMRSIRPNSKSRRKGVWRVEKFVGATMVSS